MGPREGLRAVVVPAVFRVLPEELGLERKDIVQDPIHPSSLEPVVGDHARVFELAPQRRAERSVDSRLTPDLRFLEQLKAPVERELPRPVSPQVHAVPSTSTRPDGVTRTWTLFKEGMV